MLVDERYRLRFIGEHPAQERPPNRGGSAVAEDVTHESVLMHRTTVRPHEVKGTLAERAVSLLTGWGLNGF